MIPMEPPVVGLINDAAAILVALGALLVAALVMLGKVHAQGKEIRDQVSNTHQTNLRDDLDKVKDIAGDVAKLGPQMHEITEQIRAIVGRTASIEGKVQSMSDIQSLQGRQLGEIKRDLSDERAERRQNSERIQAIDENARNEHNRMWRAIGRKRAN